VSTRFTYQAGSEFAPNDPFGQETLSFTAAGDFRYTRRKQGQVWQRQGQADPAVLASIEAGLSEAGFPVVPPHSIPPGASLITLSRADERASMDYYKGRKFTGYGVIVTRCDAWLRWLRKPSNPAAPPEGLRVEG